MRNLLGGHIRWRELIIGSHLSPLRYLSVTHGRCFLCFLKIKIATCALCFARSALKEAVLICKLSENLADHNRMLEDPTGDGSVLCSEFGWPLKVTAYRGVLMTIYKFCAEFFVLELISYLWNTSLVLEALSSF